MASWVKLCDAAEAPQPGQVIECEVEEIGICLANVGGVLSALDNWCPHRRGPLGQGWLEGTAVVCPWHSWAFDVKTGLATYPEKARVEVFPLRVDGTKLEVDLS